MLKFNELLEGAFRPSTATSELGLPRIDQVLGTIPPGLLTLVGAGRLPQQLLFHLLQHNGGLRVYYGYAFTPRDILLRVLSSGLRVPLDQCISTPRTAILRHPDFPLIKQRLRDLMFDDMFQALPVAAITAERIIADLERWREKEDQSSMVCIDEFEAWLRAATAVVGTEAPRILRLVQSMKESCRLQRSTLVIACQPGGASEEILSKVSTRRLTITPVDGTPGSEPYLDISLWSRGTPAPAVTARYRFHPDTAGFIEVPEREMAEV